jgi:HEAT repeat protein
MHAAAALGYLSTGEKDVIEALTAALKDEDETVRKEAARALKRIGVEKPDVGVEAEKVQS